MKVDKNAPIFKHIPEIAGSQYSNLPIRLEIASRILAGMWARPVDQICLYPEKALAAADALIEAHNKTCEDKNEA